MFKKTLWVGFGVAIAGCTLGPEKETVEGKNVKTGAIYSRMVVTAESKSQARVEAFFKVGGPASNTMVSLEKGDGWFASVDGKDFPLKAHSASAHIATVPLAHEQATVHVHLRRKNEESAHSSGQLPKAMTLEPLSQGTFSRDHEKLDLKWNASGTQDRVWVGFEGDCIWNTAYPTSDTGHFELDPGDLKSADKKNPKSCAVKLTITRQREGVADSKLDSDSQLVLRHERSLTFTSTP